MNAGSNVVLEKSEWTSKNEYNLDVVPDEVLYNWPILGHSFSFERSAVGFWRQVQGTKLVIFLARITYFHPACFNSIFQILNFIRPNTTNLTPKKL